MRERISLAAFAMIALAGINSSAYGADDVQYKVHSVSPTGHDRFYDVAFAADGSFYAVGSMADGIDAASDGKFLIAKYLPSGDLDAKFGKNGYVIQNVIAAGNGEVARGVVVEDDGKIIVAGPVEALGKDTRDRDIAFLRLNTDGTLDPSFGQDGISIISFSEGAVNGTAFVADGFGGLTRDAAGRLIVHGAQKRDGGPDSDFVLARLTTEGALDSSFGQGGKVTLDIKNYNASPKNPVYLPDGSIVGTGYQNAGGVVVPVIYKVNDQGQFDAGFGVNGIFSQAVLATTTEVYSVVPQGTSFVTVGYGRNNDQESLDFLSLRIDANGVLDRTYGVSGGYTRVDADGFNDNGRNMTLLPDGRILLIGGGRYSATTSEGMLAILNPDGIPDGSFGEDGKLLVDFGGESDFLWGVKVSPAGDKVVAVGIRGTASGDDAVVLTLPLQ